VSKPPAQSTPVWIADLTEGLWILRGAPAHGRYRVFPPGIYEGTQRTIRGRTYVAWPDPALGGRVLEMYASDLAPRASLHATREEAERTVRQWYATQIREADARARALRASLAAFDAAQAPAGAPEAP
jgi:hypothetical protein